MNPVVHFEMPYSDRERMVDFYVKSFGWKPHLMGAEMGNYVVMMTSEMGKDGFPTKPGRINGGMFPKTAGAAHPSIVIAVEDIRKHVRIVSDAGGKLLGEIMAIPGI